MRNGIGLELVRDLATRAQGRGLRYVEVTANPHALAFYARAGFAAGVCADVETRFGSAARLQMPLVHIAG